MSNKLIRQQTVMPLLIKEKDLKTIKQLMSKPRRSSADWDRIQDILHDHAVITAELINANRLSIEHVLFEDGWLKVFTTVKDCQDHMHRNYKDKSAETGQYCKIQAILFEDVIAIADEHHLDVIIDEPAEQGELMMIYRHEKRMLMAEVAVNLNSLFKLLGKCKVGRKKE